MAIPQSDIATYLYATLSGDSALTTLLGGSEQICRVADIQRIPLNSTVPGKVVIGPMVSGAHSGDLVLGHGRPAIMVTVTIWAVGSITMAAEDRIDEIDERIMTLVNGQDTRTVLTNSTAWFWEEGSSDVPFDEVTKAHGRQRRFRCAPVLV